VLGTDGSAAGIANIKRASALAVPLFAPRFFGEPTEDVNSPRQRTESFEMIRLITIAALAAAIAAPAFAQEPPRPGRFGAAPRQSGPVTPGTATVPGPTYPNRAKKSLDSATR